MRGIDELKDLYLAKVNPGGEMYEFHNWCSSMGLGGICIDEGQRKAYLKLREKIIGELKEMPDMKIPNREIFNDDHTQNIEESMMKLIELMKKKNADYAGSDEGRDFFGNFNLVESTYGVTTAEVGFFTRLSDKFARLASFLRKGKLENESCIDALDDITVYAQLMKEYILTKED